MTGSANKKGTNMYKTMSVCKVLILMVMPVVLATAGCNALQVRGQMAAQMPGDTARAQAIVAAENAGNLEPQGARDYLVSAGATLGGYYGTATVNPFAYLFAGKQILVTAGFYNDIQRVALAAAENARRAATTQPSSQPAPSEPAPIASPALMLSDASAVQSAIREAKDIIVLDAARRGQRP